MNWYVDDPVKYYEVVGEMTLRLHDAVEKGQGDDAYGVFNPREFVVTAPAKHFTKRELLQELEQNPDSQESHVFVDRFAFGQLRA